MEFELEQAAKRSLLSQGRRHCHVRAASGSRCRRRCALQHLRQSFDNFQPQSGGRGCRCCRLSGCLRLGSDGTSSLHWACHSRTFRVDAWPQQYDLYSGLDIFRPGEPVNVADQVKLLLERRWSLKLPRSSASSSSRGRRLRFRRQSATPGQAWARSTGEVGRMLKTARRLARSEIRHDWMLC